MNRNVLIVGLALLAYVAARQWDDRPITHPPGVLARQSPVQVEVGNSVFGLDDYILTRRARFEIKARVLSTERYRLGREADLSPLDLALGWGIMSDSSLLDQLKISQSGRWYYWRYQDALPVPESQISASSANMHMIPARKSIERTLKALRVGEVVTLEGFLVDVDHPSGWRWRTSMSRSDTGNGACEIVYVESVSVAAAD